MNHVSASRSIPAASTPPGPWDPLIRAALQRCFEALLRGRLAQADTAAALEDYRRYERVLASTEHATASATIKALVAPLVSRG